MDRTRVRITITIKETGGIRSIITYSILLLVCCNWICALKSRHILFSRRDFSLYQQTSVYIRSRFHWQWQPCPTPELVNTTASIVNKQLRRNKILQTKFIQSNTNRNWFLFWWKYIPDGKKPIFAGKKLFLPVQFLPRKKRFFHCPAKTCQPCLGTT